MASYPYLVQIAWNVVEKFVIDWQCEPYRWAQEIDFQTELVKRISTVYRYINYDTVIGNYNNALAGFENNQKWNRVCCEPKISYIYEDGKKYYCYPDIVIWDDIENPDSPPDAKEDVNWPMLWMCEIKLQEKIKQNWDLEKMTYMLKQNDVKYGCWLNLHRKRSRAGDGINWRKSDVNDRLWICTAMLPMLK